MTPDAMRDTPKPARRWRRLRRGLANTDGIAAVEFALILPLMLTLYLGSVELTKGVLAGRKVTLVARALSDLASQQLDCVSNPATAPCLTDANMTSIFGAAAAIMAPYPATADRLRMTISQIDVATSGGTLYAYTKWTQTSGTGAIARPCDGGGRTSGLSTNKSLKEANVSIGTTGYQSNFPVSYTAAGAATGSVIVADVAYDYYPGFGFRQTEWNSSATKLNMGQIQYMRTRNDGKPIYVTGAAVTKCAPNP